MVAYHNSMNPWISSVQKIKWGGGSDFSNQNDPILCQNILYDESLKVVIFYILLKKIDWGVKRFVISN
jgi:hypothetical protein